MNSSKPWCYVVLTCAPAVLPMRRWQDSNPHAVLPTTGGFQDHSLTNQGYTSNFSTDLFHQSVKSLKVNPNSSSNLSSGTDSTFRFTAQCQQALISSSSIGFSHNHVSSRTMSRKTSCNCLNTFIFSIVSTSGEAGLFQFRQILPYIAKCSFHLSRATFRYRSISSFTSS